MNLRIDGRYVVAQLLLILLATICFRSVQDRRECLGLPQGNLPGIGRGTNSKSTQCVFGSIVELVHLEGQDHPTLILNRILQLVGGPVIDTRCAGDGPALLRSSLSIESLVDFESALQEVGNPAGDFDLGGCFWLLWRRDEDLELSQYEIAVAR